jgi:hypothetical protein
MLELMCLAALTQQGSSGGKLSRIPFERDRIKAVNREDKRSRR